MFIEVSNLSHRYSKEDDYILQDINFSIEKNEFIGLVGHTGSGKSTLVQTLNGLIKPTGGQIFIEGEDITTRKDLQEIRQKVGLVFQYPEHQLFEETVYEDVAFGPHNLDLEEEEVTRRVKQALELVSLDYDEFKDRSPFKLSGGQQRRVAIAGVLAMEPEVLILDEPIAGLDPSGRRELMSEIVSLQRQFELTIILISHQMEEVASLADKVLVLEEGQLVLKGTPAEVFSNQESLEKIGLGVPQVTKVIHRLQERGWDLPPDIFSVSEARDEILKLLRG